MLIKVEGNLSIDSRGFGCQPWVSGSAEGDLEQGFPGFLSISYGV